MGSARSDENKQTKEMMSTLTELGKGQASHQCQQRVGKNERPHYGRTGNLASKKFGGCLTGKKFSELKCNG